ncbi:MAG: hypothetical protein HKO57_04375, partial [Akkermansiaceae bacterium]|nr:hypothetical protein [Akkermansiaceae bacterium]
LKEEIKELIKPAAKALIVEEDPEEEAVDPGEEAGVISPRRSPGDGVLEAIPVEPIGGEDDAGEDPADDENPE